MKLHLDKSQRLFLLGSALLLAFLFLRPVYVPLERQIARDQHWPEEQVNIFFQQELEEQQLLCFHLEGSDVLGYAVATTGKYPEIERVRTSLNKLVSRGGSIYLAYLLPFKGSTYLFLSLNENLSEIRHTYGNTTVSYPVEDGIPAAIFIPLVNGHQTYAFFDKHGNELE